MIATLLLSLLALLLPTVDEADGERAQLRQVLALLAEQPMSADVVKAYEDLHERAFRLGDLETAHAAVDALVRRLEDEPDSHSAAFAEKLHNLGQLVWGRGDATTAQPLHERSLAIYEDVLGPGHYNVASSLNALANTLWSQGRHAAARSMHERALPIYEAQRGPEHPTVAVSLNNHANVLRALGELEASRAMHERALAIREKALGPEHSDVADSLHNLAETLRGLGRLSAARALHERALPIYEASFGPESLEVARGLASLGVVDGDLGDYSASRPMFERALAIREAALGSDHPDVASTLLNLGLALKGLGDFTAARAAQERGLAIREAALGPDHPDVAGALELVALTRRSLGEFEAARTMQERALSILEQSLGPGHRSVGRALHNLALMYEDLGDLNAARALHERAVATWEAALGLDHPRIAHGLEGLGSLLERLDERAAARPLLERSLALREAAFGLVHPLVARSLDRLAFFLLGVPELTPARELFQRSLAIRETLLRSDHPTIATPLHGLASVAYMTADYAVAQRLYERALVIREAALGLDHPHLAHPLGFLVQLALDEGRLEDARDHAQSLASLRGHVRRTLASLTEGEGYRYLANLRWQRDYELTVATHLDDHDSAYGIVLDSKAQVARLTLQTRAQLRASLDPMMLDLADSLERLQGRISRLVTKTEIPDPKLHDAQVESLRVERDALERELRRKVDIVEVDAVTADHVRSALPPRSAVVDLLAHQIYRPAEFADGARVVEGRKSEPVISAWIVRPDRDVTIHVELGLASTIEEATRHFLEDLVERRGDSPATAPAEDDGNVRLRSLVWDSIARHLGDVDTVFLSPDGALGTLPFETLRDEDGRFLVERFGFVYPTSVAEMAKRPAEVASLASRDVSLLAVGGVDFLSRAGLHDERTTSLGEGATTSSSDAARPSATAAAGSASRTTVAGHHDTPPSSFAIADLRGSFTSFWGRLPATEYESQVVLDMHEFAVGDRAQCLLLQGADATEERLEQEMPRHGILHLATHGFFQPEGLPSMWQSALDAESQRRGVSMEMTESARRLTGLHPGLLSGLVFAGANIPPEGGGAGVDELGRVDAHSSTRDGDGVPVRDKDGGSSDELARDDGYLTASEVTLLDLSDVELVVLSACETGLGRPQAGEGLLGLRRAFHMAGADTVVSSLWSVKDRGTSEMMQSFYTNLLLRGMGRHESLRAAQLEMLERNRQELGYGMPSTWGAFVLSGEWR